MPDTDTGGDAGRGSVLGVVGERCEAKGGELPW